MTITVSPQQMEYMLTQAPTTGSWMHAPGSSFVFAYLKQGWPADVVTKMTNAFNDALAMSETIKNAVKTTSGQDVVNGLYLLDEPAMTKAMNSIDGMGMTTALKGGNKGSGTAAAINEQFFSGILAGLGGDIAPILDYLNKAMADVQAQTKKSTVTSEFGTIIGMVSLMPVLNVPVTTFSYVHTAKETQSFFTKVLCFSSESYSYDYEYVNSVYNYVKPTS